MSDQERYEAYQAWLRASRMPRVTAPPAGTPEPLWGPVSSCC